MNNSFHIYNRKNSSNWCMWWTDPSGKRRRATTKYPKHLYTREQAQELINAVTGTEAEIHSAPQKLSLAWMKRHVLDRVEGEGKSEGTIKEYRIAMQHLIEIYGEQYSVVMLNKSAVWQIQKHLLEKNLSPESINKTLRHLRAAVQRLVDDEILARNPFTKFKRLYEKKHDKALTDNELKAFLDVIETSENEHGRRLMYIYLYTGARRREILEVDRADIDIEKWTMRIMNIKHHAREKRTITIHPDIRDHVLWFLDGNHPKKKRLKISVASPEKPFRICAPDTVSDWVRDWFREAGIKGKTLHSLRHTFATRAVNRGNNNLRLIQEHLGHSTHSVTEKYLHKDADQDRIIDIGIVQK